MKTDSEKTISHASGAVNTPTREQVIAAFIAEFEPMDYEMKPATCHCCTFADERTQDAFMGYTAGRDQGLREAKGACIHINAPNGTNAQAWECAAAIEQLRGK